jgi:hypothetical protein
MSFLRRALAIAATVAVTMPVLAVPVAAFPALVGKDACGPELQSISESARGAHGITGKQFAEPDLGQVARELPARAQGRARADFSATVDVYFHVITDGGVGNLTTQQINEQIRVLNKTYGGQEGGAYTGFSFRLAGVTRTDNAKWYAAQPGAEKQFKKALKTGDDSDMNVYSTSGYVYLGWAYYPQITESANQSYLDGIVIDWRTVPGASDAYAGAYDLGETLTHEAGHWLNLAHTFENGCSEPGDFVDDTPFMSQPTGGCPIDKDTCPQPGTDPIHNYMDYSYDSCYTEFTTGQTQRMRDAWLLYRAS